MITTSPAPRRVTPPSWLDLRLIAGVVLVVLAVLAGAWVVARADRTDPVWSAAHDLAAGTVLTADDLSTAHVRLSSAGGRYAPVSTSLVGMTLSRPVGGGELLPRAAVGPASTGTSVTIPLDDDQAPPLSRGQRIKLWVSTKSCLATVVLEDVTVQDVQSGSGGAFSSGSGQDVTVRVPQALADRLVSALDADSATMRAGIIDGPVSSSANASLPSLSTCFTGG